ncbi:MAG: peptidase, partial [Bacilli bacterium]|nr:peptidase [Bacilli bacterium]
ILGYRDGKPIWEVKSGTAYYLVDFETGDFVKMEGL